MFYYKFVKTVGLLLCLKTVPAATEKVVTTSSGNEFSLSYDEARRKVKLEATVSKNMYLGIGFGTSMKDVDMVIFQAKGDKGVVLDTWSTGYRTPQADSQQDYTDVSTEIRYVGGVTKYFFTAYRDLDTNDIYDYKIKFDETINMIWAENRNTAELSQHTSRDSARSIKLTKPVQKPVYTPPPTMNSGREAQQCFPEESKPSRIVSDGDYLVSYYSGPSMSYMKTNQDTQWTTGGSIDFTPSRGVNAMVPNHTGRNSPSLPDENTMYYSITNGQSKESMTCVYRATAIGKIPYKKWTEDSDPAYCISGRDRFENGAPDPIDIQVHNCHAGRLWMTFGNQFSGIFLIQLNSENGKAAFNPERWTTDYYENPHWDLAKNPNTANGMNTAGEIGGSFIHYNWVLRQYYLFATYGTRNGLYSTAQIRVGRADIPKGYFIDKDGKDMLQGGGTVFIDTKNQMMPNMVGPSDSSVFTNTDQEEFFTFSFYDTTTMKETFGSYKLTWDEKGWPQVDLNKPMLRCSASSASIKPQLTSLNSQNNQQKGLSEVCHERQQLMPDGTCKECAPFTRAQGKYSCGSDVCNNGEKIREDGTCSRCDLLYRVSNDGKTCVQDKCNDRQVLTREGTCKYCSAYTRACKSCNECQADKCKKNESIQPDGTCKECPLYTRVLQDTMCLPEQCKPNQMLKVDGTCQDCGDYKVASNDQKSCIMKECPGLQIVLKDARCASCPSYTKPDKYRTQCVNDECRANESVMMDGTCNKCRARTRPQINGYKCEADTCQPGEQTLEDGTCDSQEKVNCHARQIIQYDRCKDCEDYTRSSKDRTRCVSAKCTMNQKLLKSGTCQHCQPYTKVSRDGKSCEKDQCTSNQIIQFDGTCKDCQYGTVPTGGGYYCEAPVRDSPEIYSAFLQNSVSEGEVFIQETVGRIDDGTVNFLDEDEAAQYYADTKSFLNGH